MCRDVLPEETRIPISRLFNKEIKKRSSKYLSLLTKPFKTEAIFLAAQEAMKALAKKEITDEKALQDLHFDQRSYDQIYMENQVRKEHVSVENIDISLGSLLLYIKALRAFIKSHGSFGEQRMETYKKALVSMTFGSLFQQLCIVFKVVNKKTQHETCVKVTAKEIGSLDISLDHLIITMNEKLSQKPGGKNQSIRCEYQIWHTIKLAKKRKILSVAQFLKRIAQLNSPAGGGSPAPAPAPERNYRRDLRELLEARRTGLFAGLFQSRARQNHLDIIQMICAPSRLPLSYHAAMGLMIFLEKDIDSEKYRENSSLGHLIFTIVNRIKMPGAFEKKKYAQAFFNHRTLLMTTPSFKDDPRNGKAQATFQRWKENDAADVVENTQRAKP